MPLISYVIFTIILFFALSRRCTCCCSLFSFVANHGIKNSVYILNHILQQCIAFILMLSYTTTDIVVQIIKIAVIDLYLILLFLFFSFRFDLIVYWVGIIIRNMYITTYYYTSNTAIWHEFYGFKDSINSAHNFDRFYFNFTRILMYLHANLNSKHIIWCTVEDCLFFLLNYEIRYFVISLNLNTKLRNYLALQKIWIILFEQCMTGDFFLNGFDVIWQNLLRRRFYYCYI